MAECRAEFPDAEFPIIHHVISLTIIMFSIGRVTSFFFCTSLRQAFFEIIVTPILEATSSLITTTLSFP